MRILVVGASGYIGTQLIIVLAEAGHDVVVAVRSTRRLVLPEHLIKKVEVLERDLLEPVAFPKELDAAYYLIHSMGRKASGFAELEETCAKNFLNAISNTSVKQIVYLSGLYQGDSPSEHMSSRRKVEEILFQGKIPLTVLRAGIILGAGSASFEMIRDLVEKLPIMVAPKWVYSKCQPIAISDVLFYLVEVLEKEGCFNQVFEIGGSDLLTYRDMLLQFAKIRGLKRWIIPVPVLTPYLSSLWLFFVTSVSFPLARALVNSLKTDAVCLQNKIQEVIPHVCLHFDEAIRRAFEKIQQNAMTSSWKDALVKSKLDPTLADYIEVPRNGCLFWVYKRAYVTPKEDVIKQLWQIGGKNGWYTMNWAWMVRGWLDRLVGGVGLRRGRTHPTELHSGDTLDFWRVLVAEKEKGHLLLYAEMSLPGEAWLEWNISESDQYTIVEQAATFRPRGLIGRLYWYVLYPMHFFIFSRLCDQLGGKRKG